MTTRTTIATRAVDVPAGTITFKFGHGEEIVVNANELTPDIQKHLMLHGLSQKLGDSYSDADGNSTVAVGMLKGVLEGLQKGVWTTRTPGEGKGGGLLAEALSRATGKPLADCAKKVGEMDKDKRAALRKHASIAPILAKIEAERAAEKAAKLAANAGEGGEGLDAIFG